MVSDEEENMMGTAEKWQEYLSFLALGSAIAVSGILFYRIIRGDVPLAEAGLSSFLPLLGSVAIASPGLKQLAVSRRLEKLEMERE